MPLCFVLTMSISCKAQKSTSSSPNVIRIDDNYKYDGVKKGDTTKSQKDEIQIKEDGEVKDSVDTISRKDVYEIALLMPFQETLIRQLWTIKEKENLEDFKFTNDSEQSISFLQGMMYAFKTDSVSQNYNITVYDLGASEIERSLAISKMLKNKPDLIIGGLNRAEVKDLSDFSLKHNIPYFSPFVPSSSLVKNNANYTMLEPGIDMHLREIASFMADSLSESNLILLHENNDQSKNFAAVTNNYFDIFKRDLNTKIELVEVATNASERKNFSIEKYLKPDVRNVVFIPSFNEGFLHAMLTNLNARAHTNEIVLFGMPTWGDAETLQFRHFNALNLHMTSSKWMNSTETENIRAYFMENYKKDAAESALYGYEVMKLTDELLENFGLEFMDNLTDLRTQGFLRNYIFQSVTNEDENVIRYENTALRIVKIQNFELILVR